MVVIYELIRPSVEMHSYQIQSQSSIQLLDIIHLQIIDDGGIRQSERQPFGPILVEVLILLLVVMHLDRILSELIILLYDIIHCIRIPHDKIMQDSEENHSGVI